MGRHGSDAVGAATIGRFRLDGALEPAANGYVGRGVDGETGRGVFLKQFDRYVMPSDEALGSGSASAAARRDRFRSYVRRLNEVDRRLMRVCGAGPTLVKPVALVRNGNKLVHVTELVDTERVVPADEVHERFARDEIIAMFKGVLTTVGAIHGQGVVLVDVKDGNMFVVDGPDGPQARVFDYDDAVLEGQVPDASEIVGTPEYYSPELALYTMHSEPGDELGTKGSPLARAIDRRHDIFALGLVLHLYLTGGLPGARADATVRGGGKAARRKAARGPVPPWQAVMRGGDGALELAPSLRDDDRALIAWMLRRNPAERPASCGEVLARLCPRPASRVRTAAATPRGAERAVRTRDGAERPAATAWPPRAPVSTEGDDIVFDAPRDGLVLSLSALPAGKVRLRLADGRTLDKRVGELKLYGLADQVEPVSRIARARFGAYW